MPVGSHSCRKLRMSKREVTTTGFTFKSGSTRSRANASAPHSSESSAAFAALPLAAPAAASPGPSGKRAREGQPATVDGAVPQLPSLNADSIIVAGKAPEAQLLELVRTLVERSREAVSVTCTGNLAYVTSAANELLSGLESAATEHVVGASKRRSAATQRVLAAGSGRANPVNERNAVRLRDLQSHDAAFSKEIAQWEALARKYAPATPAGLMSDSSKAADAAAAGASPAPSQSARKRKAPAVAASPPAAAAASALSSSSVDPYDVIDDGEMDETYLAKYRLAGSLGDNVTSGLSDMVVAATSIRSALAAAASTVSASQGILAAVSKAVRAAAFQGLPGVLSASGGAEPAGNGAASSHGLPPLGAGTKALLRAAIATGPSAPGGLAPPPAQAASSLLRVPPPLPAEGALSPAGAASPGSLPALGSASRGRSSVPDVTPSIIKKLRRGI